MNGHIDLVTAIAIGIAVIAIYAAAKLAARNNPFW